MADRRVALRDFAYLERLWRRWSPGLDPGPHPTRVRDTFRRSMPGPIAVYRADGFDIGDVPIAVPTLFVAGAEDGCLLPAPANGRERLFANGYEAHVPPGVGHWPHLERPGEVAGLALDWFGRFGS